MKFAKRYFLLLFLSLAVAFSANSQDEIAKLLSGSVEDANTLGKAYLEPFGKSFGTSLNNGWYNTAKPHKLFGFDITLAVALTVIPSADKTFDVSKLNLNYWKLGDVTKNISPTLAGDDISGPMLVPIIPAPGVQLQLPPGANLPFVSLPIVQVGIGLPFNTEVVGRYFPQFEIPDVGQLSLWGVGVKNEFKEFIPGLKLLPFNLSAFVGYTKFQSSFDVDAPKPAGSTKKQEVVFEASGITGKLLISKSIPVLTVYAGVGYTKSTTDVALKGDYTVVNIPGVPSLSDPITLDFMNSGISANLGIRIKLAVIAFHFDYSLGSYAVYNAGFGINFR